MKQINLLFVILIAWLLSGCTSDPTAMSESEPSLPTQEVSHVVPVEHALEELQSVLDVIDSPSENDVVTRSGGVRCVKDVATVSSDILPVSTRSGETNDVENLFYIVNFEEENGYAILGADNRLESVYAIVDEGSLTPEELQQAVTISDEEAETNGELVFPLKMVVQAAAAGIGGPIGGIGVRDPFDPNKPAPTLIRTEAGEYTTRYYIPPQIPVKWGQRYPYNASVKQIGGQYCLAGCPAIAVAQLLVANYYQHGSCIESFRGERIDWNLIRAAIDHPKTLMISEKDVLTPEAKEVSRLIAAIGAMLNMDYGLDGSGASMTDVQRCLVELQYKGVYNHTYRDSYVHKMIFERKRTAIVNGESRVGRKSRHEWNLDGWFHRTRPVTYYYSDGGEYTADEGQVLIHCNFGWNGLCNGYYQSGLFNLDQKPCVQEDGETFHTDPNNPNGNYSAENIITYTEIP